MEYGIKILIKEKIRLAKRIAKIENLEGYKNKTDFDLLFELLDLESNKLSISNIIMKLIDYGKNKKS